MKNQKLIMLSDERLVSDVFSLIGSPKLMQLILFRIPNRVTKTKTNFHCINNVNAIDQIILD